MSMRMKEPLAINPDLMPALQAVHKAASRGKLPVATAHLVHLRASQINSCSFCVQMHAAELKKDGVPDEKVHLVAAWRETTHFTEAERAALALCEAMTRLADRPEAITDEIWGAAAKQFDEPQLVQLLAEIAMINVWNRLNAAVRRTVGPER